MSSNIQDKKFDFRVVQKRESWTTEITRRVSARKIHVSKRKAGFATEAEAREWGEAEIKIFSNNLKEKNTRDSIKRNKSKYGVIKPNSNKDIEE